MKLHKLWIAVASGACGLLLAATVQAQPPRDAFGGFGAGGLGGGSLELLQREDVRSELELLDDQAAELRRLREAMVGKLREALTQSDGGSREERFQKIRDFAAETQAQVDKILLPHQQKRLEQLANQFRMRGGATGSLANDRLADELGLSEAQKQKLRARAEQLDAELRQKLTELRKQAQDELLKELTPEQQAKWRDMVGEPFEFARGEGQFGRGAAEGSPGGQPGLRGGQPGLRGGLGGRRGT